MVNEESEEWKMEKDQDRKEKKAGCGGEWVEIKRRRRKSSGEQKRRKEAVKRGVKR